MEKLDLGSHFKNWTCQAVYFSGCCGWGAICTTVRRNDYSVTVLFHIFLLNASTVLYMAGYVTRNVVVVNHVNVVFVWSVELQV